MKAHKAKIYTPKLRLIIVITELIFHEKWPFFGKIQAQKVKIWTAKLRLIIFIARLIFYEKFAFFLEFELRYIGKNTSKNLEPKVAVVIVITKLTFFYEKLPFTLSVVLSSSFFKISTS